MQAGKYPGTVKTFLDNAIAFIRETCEILPAHDLITPAWDLSYHHRITISDALFVAASIRYDVPLVTADTRLAGAVSKTCPVILIE